VEMGCFGEAGSESGPSQRDRARCKARFIMYRQKIIVSGNWVITCW
jgi:hypothetical protein